MKGDFTRFTFQPQKHYSSVLMQQGRLQIDADWNEQMSILNHLNQIQTKDLIGSRSGTSSIAGGYQILPVNLTQSTSSAATPEGAPTETTLTETTSTGTTPTGTTLTESFVAETTPSAPDLPTSEPEQVTDLLITEGRFYIDGILCELNPGTQILADWISFTQLQVSALTLDGQTLEPNQWIELEIPTRSSITAELEVQIKQCKILEVKPEEFMLTLTESISPPAAGQRIKLRRLTTYKTQATYPNPEALASDVGIYLAYLDVWQRHVTALDDRSLKEVALNGLDTTTRLQTIAQVKLLNITADLDKLIPTTGTAPKTKLANSYDNDNKIFSTKPDLADLVVLPAWQALTTRSVLMNATTAINPTSSDTLGNYQGGDNRLYRVEVHRDDRAADTDVIFKWSRDNGSIVSAIDRIEGDVVFLKGSIQEEYNLFRPTTSQAKENPWVEIISEAQELNNQPGVLVQLRGVKPPNLLLLDLSQVQGGSQPRATAVEAERQSIKVRRWDGQMSPKTDWQLLEQGIQVQFPNTDSALFRNGDFWLLPVRAGQPLAWVRDLPQLKSPLGKPIAQHSLGIEHHYGIVAVVKADQQGSFSSAVATDETWEQADLRTTFLPLIEIGNSAASLGERPEAQLYVRGKSQTAVGTIRKISDKTIGIADTQTKLLKGYTLTINGETALIEAVNTSGGEQRLTLDQDFTSLPTAPGSPFTYRKPLIRLETDGAIEPQFFLNPFGNIGLNTAEPAAKLDIRGSSTESIDFLQVKSEAATLFKIQPDGKVGIGVDKPDGVFDVRTPGGTLFKVQPDGDVVIDINQSGGIFDVRDSKSTLFKVQQSDSRVGIGVDPPQARLDVRNTFRVTAPGTLPANSAFLQIESQANQPIAFTSHSGNAQGYSFDQKVTVKKGGITVENDGGASITGEVAIATDQIIVNSTGTRIKKGVTLPTGDLKIDNGSLTIGNDPDADKNSTFTKDALKVENLTVRKSLTLTGTSALMVDSPITVGENGSLTTNSNVTINLPGNKKITLASDETNSVVIDLPKGKLAIQKDDTPLVTLSPFGSPANNPKLYVAGNVVIGNSYKEESTGLPNSLIVQDRVQIATNDPAPNPGGMTDIDQSKLKLYVNGDACINGKLFAQKVGATTIEQVSSGTLKENITTLSTLEAQQMLRQLNPVKFNYTLPIDTTPRVGFIAEEVPDLLTSPDHQSVCLLDIIGVLTKTVKDLNQTIQDQQEAIAVLAQRVQKLSEDDRRNGIQTPFF